MTIAEENMDRETSDKLKDLTERVDEVVNNHAIVVSTAPFAVTYTVNNVAKRYEGPTIDDVMMLVEADLKRGE